MSYDSCDRERERHTTIKTIGNKPVTGDTSSIGAPSVQSWEEMASTSMLGCCGPPRVISIPKCQLHEDTHAPLPQ